MRLQRLRVDVDVVLDRAGERAQLLERVNAFVSIVIDSIGTSYTMDSDVHEKACSNVLVSQSIEE